MFFCFHKSPSCTCHSRFILISLLHVALLLRQAGASRNPSAAMADHFDALFEIGDAFFRYRLTDKNINDAPIYQSYYATDRNPDYPVNLGQLKFRTFEPVQNIEDEQWVEWQQFDTRRLRWEGSMLWHTHPISPIEEVSSPEDDTEAVVFTMVPTGPVFLYEEQ